MQNLLKNLMSGLMILGEQPFRLGDLVEIGGIRGTVTNIGLRASTINDMNGIDTIVPNSSFIEQNLTNWTLTNGRVRFNIRVSVAYGSPVRTVVTGGNSQVSMFLSETTFAGGADNAPALTKAWDLATETPGNNAIVWIHSPQRTTLSSVEPLLNRMKGRFYGPSLYSVQTSDGSDEIVKKLDGINEVKSVVRLGSLGMDLERLFQQLSGQVPTLEFVRSVKHPQLDPAFDGVETSNHLAELWANDEVARILGARDVSLKEAATLLALRYKLVTPTSGAVTMERATQIDRGDLEPVTPFTLTEVAEVDLGSLFFLAFVFFVWLIYVKIRRTPAVYIT